MAATIMRATRTQVVVSGKVSLKALARLIELSKRLPNPAISEIELIGGQVSMATQDHATNDYFTIPWVEVVVTIEDYLKNMTRNMTKQKVTIDNVEIV